MDTIVPSQSATIGQVAQFIYALERQGVTGVHIQRVIDDIELRDEVARLMRGDDKPLIDTSGEFHLDKVKQFVAYMWKDDFRALRTHDGSMSWKQWRIVDSETHEDMATSQTVRELLSGLGPLQMAVVVWRLGLLDGKAVTAKDVAERVGIPPAQVNNIRKGATKHIKERAKRFSVELVPTEHARLKDLWHLDRRIRFFSGVDELTVGEVIRRGRTELIDEYGLESYDDGLDVLVEFLARYDFSLA